MIQRTCNGSLPNTLELQFPGIGIEFHGDFFEVSFLPSFLPVHFRPNAVLVGALMKPSPPAATMSPICTTNFSEGGEGTGRYKGQARDMVIRDSAPPNFCHFVVAVASSCLT